MSGPWIRLSAKDAPQLREVFGSLFTEDSGGLLTLVEAGERRELVPEETFDAARSVTVYRGAPATFRLLDRLTAQGEATAWLALNIGWPLEGRLVRQPILRLGRPDGWLPLAELEVAPTTMTLHFRAAGAPLLAPPSRDAGGPIDRAFDDLVVGARAELRGWLERARARGLMVTVGQEGVDSGPLAAALGLSRAP